MTPTIKTAALVALAATAAESYSEYADALALLEESFGVPYNAAKDCLTRDINVALKQGVDLQPFTGAESRFKFPEFRTNIVVRISRETTEHSTLTKLAAKVTELEQKLKLAKKQLSNAAEELLLKGEVEQVPAKVTLAFTALK